MSKETKKIKEKVENVYYKSFEESLQVQAILKCLECACYYYEEELTIADVKMVISVIIHKMKKIEEYLDVLSLI